MIDTNQVSTSGAPSVSCRIYIQATQTLEGVNSVYKFLNETVGCLKMSNRQAIKKAEFQALDAWDRHPRLNIKALARRPRLSIQT